MGHSRFRPTQLAWLGATLLALAMAAPVSAQAQVVVQFGRPQARGFSNNYPWFNNVPQYSESQSFQYFLAYHPDIAQALSINPGLLYNAAWRSENPDLEQYLNTHPYEWQALNNANWSTGPAETQWGYYDSQHQWRDAYWWHENDPNWFYDNHQDWASLDSRWLVMDGAYDQQNQWHYGEWWYNQNPGWVTSNHPGWLSQHQNWSNAAEQRSYRQGHAMGALNQSRQQASALPRANSQQASRQQARPVAQANRQQTRSTTQASRQQSRPARQASRQQARPAKQASRQQARPAQASRQQARPARQASRQQARPARASRQQARPRRQAVSRLGPPSRRAVSRLGRAKQASRQQARPAKQASRQQARPQQVARANKR